ncbi:MAG TPA: enolase C-terminal domain-like protein [Casimicrobiaceae bacterium]|nr:enolase C-terminal domain-like protein [Casimicrobiaceae bacterium]
MINIERVDVRRLAVPLTRPYKLAFGPVTQYDTILVDVTGSDGQRGFGEATLLTGYTDETIDDSERLAYDVAAGLPGIEVAEACSRMRVLGERAPFVATAFHTALDMASGYPLLAPKERLRVPILGLLQGDDEAQLSDAFERLRASGYRTVKVKIGFDVDVDLRTLAAVQSVVAGRAAIRIDANQGYTAAEAIAFVRAADPADVELFEQPCAAEDWDAHMLVAEAAARRGLPLMLDESIYAITDSERAARERACAYLKVKLMKFVAVDALAAAIERIRALGMQPVLGNGVACDVSCWMEACVAARHIDNAGEMNGFLKADRMLFAHPLALENGDIVVETGVPALDDDALAFHTRAHRTFHRESAGCRTPS